MPVKLGAKDTNGCSGEKPYPLLEVATGKKVACAGPTREDALKALQVRNMAHAGVPVGQKARDWARRVFGRPSGPPKEKAEGPMRIYRDQTTGLLYLLGAVEPPAEPDEGEPVVKSIRILRADPEKQIVYGIVMEPADPAEISKWEGGGRTDPPPEGVDSEGDWTLEPDIEIAAHAFMQKYRAQQSAMGLQHQVEAPTVVIVESYIAPQDITLGTEVARKGSWVMGAHVTDAELWDAVKKGNLTGFSIGGRGERV